jgi:hypothetical protein
MTAPTLSQKKFYIIKPAEGTNQIKNPRFDPPDFEEDWLPYGGGVTVEETGSEQRFGAYCMQVNTASGVKSYAIYINVTVTNGDDYTFSCYVKGTAGQAMSLNITNSASVIKGSTSFTTTGYWQRQEVTITAAENASNYRLEVVRDAVASTDPFYVDGAQFEQASAASTLIHGYGAGCRWTGAARNSSSYRPATTAAGGEIVDLEDYCHIVQVTGLGHGDWNQIMTKMTSGGDMYQTHIRKSRNFSIVVDFLGSSLGEIEANRKAVIDLIRPDRLRGQEMVVRYQGVDVNGNEATHPVDIKCVPLPATLVDTPDLPSYQRGVLNFAVPSGLLEGAYNEGAELDLYADFPAEYIVKRDPGGNWCKWNGSAYESLITGVDVYINCIAEGPDGKIYVGSPHAPVTPGGAYTNGLKVWDNATGTWTQLLSTLAVSGTQGVVALCFDAAGDLYFGGGFSHTLDLSLKNLAKCKCGTGSSEIESIAGQDDGVYALAMSPSGDLYIGAGILLQKWDGTSFSTLHTFDSGHVYDLAFAPNGDLYIGGSFTDSDYPYLCKWNGSAMSVVGTNTDIGGAVYSLAFGSTGWLYVGGNFTNAGGIVNADYIAKWNGANWEALGTGVNGAVHKISANSGKVYVSGAFTTAGGLTLTDRVAVWSNGAWQPLDIDLPGTSNIYSILPASDNSLYISGIFSSASSSDYAETGIVALNLEVSSASANTYPFMQVRGPGTLKAITNYSTGKTIAFDGLTLNAGEWINLHFDPLNLRFYGGWSGRGNLMRYVVPGSDYGDFYLMPGSNLISLFMTDTTTDSGAFIFWTPLFWGIDGAVLE